MEATKERVSEALRTVMHELEDGLRRGRFTAEEIQSAMAERSKHAVTAANAFVHEKPWTVIGAAALMGCVAAWLLFRR